MTQAIIDEVLEVHPEDVWHSKDSFVVICSNCCVDETGFRTAKCIIDHPHTKDPNNRCETVRIITKERPMLIPKSTNGDGSYLVGIEDCVDDLESLEGKVIFKIGRKIRIITKERK